MKRKGCKPKGSALVEHLDGSLQAKERLEVILDTLTGQLTIGQACQRLGVKEARFHRLRMEVLEASLARLEPRSVGRPRQTATAEEIRSAELEHHVAELESELKIATVREEIARVLSPIGVEGTFPLKKTTELPPRRT
jgi:transposase-like protein